MFVRLLAAVAISAGLGLVPAAATSANASPAAQGRCIFTLGFKALRDQIPNAVGDCLENESFNTENGNAEQPTTGGLLVWRKADNWTAFTNGDRTWINGPNGLQSRLNREPLFPWEAATPSDIEAYLLYMQPWLKEMGPALENLIDQYELAGADPQRVSDQEWRSETNSVLNRLRAIGTGMRGYPLAPASVGDLDRVMKSMGEDLTYIADEFSAWMAESSDPRLQNALKRIETLALKAEQANRELTELLPTSPLPD